MIQKKLETVHFKPLLVTQNEAIEEFLKYDLNTFIEKVGLTGNSINGLCNNFLDESCDKKVKSIMDLPVSKLFDCSLININGSFSFSMK